MRRFRLFGLLAAGVLVAALGSGCYTFSYRDPGPSRPFVRPSEPLAAFEYDPATTRVKVFPPQKETATYAVSLVKIKGREFDGLEKDDARVYWLGPRDPGANAPLLIVLPPTGGSYELSLFFGEYFARRGFAVLCFLRREKFFKPEHDIDYHQELFRQTVIDIRRGIDWASAQPGVDGARVGVLGVSLGAIFSQLVMQADGRVGAGALLLGGQDLPLILESSGYLVVDRYRRALRKLYHVDADGLRAVAREHFGTVDPRNYRGRIDPARVLMISGRYDNIIRYEVTRETWENLGYPTLRVIPAGHYSSALFLPSNMARIYRHFERLLGPPGPAALSAKGDAHAANP